MQPHQQRVIEEQDELKQKFDRLCNFIDSQTYDDLDEAEQGRLCRQVLIMEQYIMILNERIAAF